MNLKLLLLAVWLRLLTAETSAGSNGSPVAQDLTLTENLEVEHKRNVEEADCATLGEGSFVFGCSSYYVACQAVEEGYVKRIMRCSTGHNNIMLIMNPEINQCDYEGNVNLCYQRADTFFPSKINDGQLFTCKGKDNGPYAIHACSHEYVVCDSGTATFAYCSSEHLYFNPERAVCIHKTFCGKKDIPDTEVAKSVSKDSQFTIPSYVNCTDRKLTSGGECSEKFWNCGVNVPAPARCPGGLFFSEAFQSCLAKEHVKECNSNVAAEEIRQKYPEVSETVFTCPKEFAITRYMYFDDNTTWFDEVKECYPEYVQCFNGHSVLLRCPQDTVFDLTAKKCVPVPSCSANPNAIGELAMPSIVTCKDKAKGVHALQLCHKSHLLCDGKKNKPTILQCKYGYVFERGLCVLDSQCQRTVAEIVDESIATGASNSTFQGCQGQHDGFYEFSKCASSFVHCINEIGYKIACEERLVFKDGRCVWPDFCEFDRALINEEPTAAPVLRSLNSEPIPNLRVDCSRDGLFEIGRCQNQYLVCADAQPTLVKCLNKLVFYGHNRSCIELKGCLELEKAKMNLRSGMIKPMEKNVPPHADADEDQDHDHLVKWTSEGPPKEEIVEHPAPIPLVNKPVASLCEGKEDGKYVIEKCSRSYVSCENGTASVMNCPELLAYNGTNCSDSHACDLELSRAVKTISHTKPADTLPLGTSSIYQPKANSNSKRLIRQPKLGKGEYVPLLVPDYKCPTDGWFAEGYCLHFYIQCSNGYGYRFKCAANLVWSGHTCVWPRDCRTTKKQELEKHFFPGIEIVPDNENPFDKENKCATLNNCFLPTEKCGPSYIECVDRKTVYKTCPPGKIFKVETSSCEPPFYVVGCEPKKGAALPVPPPFCQGKLNGYHDIGGCSTQFYYCINGEGDEHSCQENLYYDYLTQKCQVKEHVVSCGGSRFVEPPKDHVHGKNKSLKVDRFCAGKANGYYGLNGCHNFYYDCQNQVTKKVKCPLKLFYDDEIGHCDLSYHIPVCGGTRPVSTISKPKVPPFCVNRKDGKYGDAGCNTYFYVCRNQETEKQHCQPGLVFDPDLEKCHLKEFVPCCGGVRPTKPLVAPRDPFCDHKHDGTYPGGECQSFYYRCTGQVTTKLACPNDQVYNPEISACARRERIPVCGGSRATAKPTEQPSEVDRFCYGKSYGTYAVSSCSAFFYQCQPGRSQKTPCPHNLAYNAETNKCERQEYVPSCKGIPPTLAPKDPQPPTENDSFCNNKPDGSYAANKCAPFFYQCSSGRSTKTPCLYELVYDAEMDRCGKKEHIPSCGGVRPPTQTTPVNPLPLHVYDPFCVAKANGTYPVGTCSNLYYECFDGYTWKMPCAVGLFFDAEIVKCDHKEHIPSCGGIRPTIPPPVPTRPYDSFCENSLMEPIL